MNGEEGWRQSCFKTVRRGGGGKVAISEGLTEVFVVARPMAGAQRL